MPIEVSHCRNMDFRPFLLLWPWPWPGDLHIWTWSVGPSLREKMSEMNFLRQGFRELLYYILHTPPKSHTTPLRGWSTNKIINAVQLHKINFINTIYKFTVNFRRSPITELPNAQVTKMDSIYSFCADFCSFITFVVPLSQQCLIFCCLSCSRVVAYTTAVVSVVLAMAWETYRRRFRPVCMHARWGN